jgi:hypothetical protein
MAKKAADTAQWVHRLRLILANQRAIPFNGSLSFIFR